MWKFHDFSNIQILREIYFVDIRSVNSAILTHVKWLDFDFLWIFTLFEGCNLPNLQNSEPLKLQKTAVLVTVRFSKIDFFFYVKYE